MEESTNSGKGGSEGKKQPLTREQLLTYIKRQQATIKSLKEQLEKTTVEEEEKPQTQSQQSEESEYVSREAYRELVAKSKKLLQSYKEASKERDQYKKRVEECEQRINEIEKAHTHTQSQSEVEAPPPETATDDHGDALEKQKEIDQLELKIDEQEKELKSYRDDAAEKQQEQAQPQVRTQNAVVAEEVPPAIAAVAVDDASEKQTEIDQLNQRVGELEREAKMLKDEKEAVENDMKQRQHEDALEKRKEIDQFKQKVEELERQRDTLENEMKQRENEYGLEKQKEIDQLKRKVDELETQKDAAENEWTTERKESAQQVKALQDENERLHPQIQTAVDDAGGQLDNLKEEMTQLRGSIEEKDSEIEAKTQELETIKRMQGSSETSITITSRALENNVEGTDPSSSSVKELNGGSITPALVTLETDTKRELALTKCCSQHVESDMASSLSTIRETLDTLLRSCTHINVEFSETTPEPADTSVTVPQKMDVIEQYIKSFRDHEGALRQKLSDANASIEELKANHEAQMNQLKQALDEAHQKHDKLLQEKDGLEKQLKSKENDSAKLDQLNDQIRQYRNQEKDFRQDIQNLKKRCNNLDADNERMKNELEEKAQKLKSYEEKLEAGDSASKKNDELNRKIQQQRKLLRQQQGMIRSLQKDLSAVNQLPLLYDVLLEINLPSVHSAQNSDMTESWAYVLEIRHPESSKDHQLGSAGEESVNGGNSNIASSFSSRCRWLPFRELLKWDSSLCASTKWRSRLKQLREHYKIESTSATASSDEYDKALSELSSARSELFKSIDGEGLDVNRRLNSLLSELGIDKNCAFDAEEYMRNLLDGTLSTLFFTFMANENNSSEYLQKHRVVSLNRAVRELIRKVWDTANEKNSSQLQSQLQATEEELQQTKELNLSLQQDISRIRDEFKRHKFRARRAVHMERKKSRPSEDMDGYENMEERQETRAIEELEALKAELEQLKRKAEQLQEENQYLRKSKDDLRSELEILTNDYRSLEKSNSQKKEKSSGNSDNSKLLKEKDSEIEKLERMLETQRNRLKSTQDELRECRRKLLESQSEVAQLKSTNSSLQHELEDEKQQRSFNYVSEEKSYSVKRIDELLEECQNKEEQVLSLRKALDEAYQTQSCAKELRGGATNNEDLVNIQYLRNIVFNFITTTGESEKKNMIPALATMLGLSEEQRNSVEAAVEEKSTGFLSSVWSSVL